MSPYCPLWWYTCVRFCHHGRGRYRGDRFPRCHWSVSAAGSAQSSESNTSLRNQWQIGPALSAIQSAKSAAAGRPEMRRRLCSSTPASLEIVSAIRCRCDWHASVSGQRWGQKTSDIAISYQTYIHLHHPPSACTAAAIYSRTPRYGPGSTAVEWRFDTEHAYLNCH